MEKDIEKTYNGSYLYRLNEELSGQAELEPYFFDSLNEEAVPQDSVLQSTLAEEVEEQRS
jgi:hypothetical protein